jgi:hypothetical protein
MTQLQMFDPRIAPTATAEMLADGNLRRAIARMRRGNGGSWPYVERICDIGGRPAWLVDDDGMRYVVVNLTIWHPDELDVADRRLRLAAMEAMARLDEIGKQGEAA